MSEVIVKQKENEQKRIKQQENINLHLLTFQMPIYI